MTALEQLTVPSEILAARAAEEARHFAAKAALDHALFEQMIRKVFLSGPPDKSGWTGNYKAREVRRQLLESPDLSAVERAEVLGDHAFKNMLSRLADDSEYIGEYRDQTFAFYWPEQYALHHLKCYGDESLFLHFLLRRAFLSGDRDPRGFVGPFTADEVRERVLCSNVSQKVKDRVPNAEGVRCWLCDLSQCVKKRDVVSFKGKTDFLIFWPDEYRIALKHIEDGTWISYYENSKS